MDFKDGKSRDDSSFPKRVKLDGTPADAAESAKSFIRDFEAKYGEVSPEE